jgi:hypothetical protein
MKEKPIIFSSPMVKAILEDKKDMTRRVVKGSPCTDTNGSVNIYGFWFIPGRDKDHAFDGVAPYCVGEHLWVREAFQSWKRTNIGDVEPPVYNGKDGFYTIGEFDYAYKADSDNPDERWRPSIFMPREASRISLEVKNVRIERVQDITEEDAKAEGVAGVWDYLTDTQWKEYVDRLSRSSDPISNTDKHAWGYKNYLWYGHFGKHGMGNKNSDAWEYQRSNYDTAKGSFSSLWELINAKRGYPWESNPWVYVYEFMRLT